MSLVDELKEAYSDVICDFSQEDWEDAIIEGFKKAYSMIIVMRFASGKKHRFSNTELKRIFEHVQTLHPPFVNFEPPMQCVCAWVAKVCPKAGEALWNGEEEKARLLLRKTKYVPAQQRQSMIPLHEKRAQRRDEKCTVNIKARDLGKLHDWNTVK